MMRTKNLHIYLYRKINLLIGLFFLIITCFLPSSTINAASLKIRYNGKNYSYKSSQASMSLDGTTIDLHGTPGVLIDDTCMLPASDVFRKGLGASYHYDKATKQLKIKQNDVSVEMTLNNRTAYINGKKVTCDVAPRQIKFMKLRKTKIFVPARFVAEALGYTYNWNSSSKTSELQQPFVIKYGKNWTIYKGTKGNVIFNESDIDVSDMPSIVLDNTSLLRADKVFKEAMGAEYSYDEETNTILITQNDITLLMTVDSDIAFVNGQRMTMKTKARRIENKGTQKSYIMVPGKFVATNLGYEYDWDSATKTSIIKTGKISYFSEDFAETNKFGSGIQDILSAIEAFSYDKKDTLSLKTKEDIDVSVTELDDTYLQLKIQNVVGDMPDFSKTIEEGIFLNAVDMRMEESTLIIDVYKNPESTYYTSQTSEKFDLVLCKNSNTQIDNQGFQIKFDCPESLDFESIKTEDQYYKNQFVIYLTGDYESYFNEHPIQYTTSVIRDVNVSLVNKEKTKITVKTKSIKGFKLNDCGDYIGVNVANPSSIYDKIIVLDAGHGGKDNGTAHKGTKEKDVNYTIIYELAKEYFNSKDSTIKAYWTRWDDTFISLYDRADFANKVDADVFVSLHMNAATPKAKGLEVYYSKDNKHTMGDLTSKKMADVFFKQLIDDLEMDKRSVKSAGFVVVKKNTVPSILIELGFLSNTSDYEKLTDPDFQDFAAQSIYDSAVSLFDSYPTGR